MKAVLFALAAFFGSTSAQAAEAPVPGWECSRWADGTYYLYCGGAVIGHYQKALDCISARKEICGPAQSDYECRRWPDDTYYLYCGTAYIGHYKTAKECIKGKRALCD